MRILIIGGTGIISTGITRLLIERGDDVVLYNQTTFHHHLEDPFFSPVSSKNIIQNDLVW